MNIVYMCLGYLVDAERMKRDLRSAELEIEKEIGNRYHKHSGTMLTFRVTAP